ncbi:MAG: thioesterase family protein [Pseudomonadota bacterium]
MDSAAPAPLITSEQRVLPDWIDYNGHMNVAYYTLAFDHALDEAYDSVGVGPCLVKSHGMGPMALQTQIHYLDELLEGEAFTCRVMVLDADAKRVHVFAEMLKGDGAVAATYESLTLNVDLNARRAAPFPEEAAARLQALKAAHAGLTRPRQVGAPLGIRRKA